MANRTRFRATGLAALVGRLSIKHSTSSQKQSQKSSNIINTQTAIKGKTNAGSRRKRKA